MNKQNDDFLYHGRVKPDDGFSKALLHQLHQTDRQEQDDMNRVITQEKTTIKRTPAQPILLVAAMIAVLFFSLTWLANSPSSGVFVETINQPELIHQLGDYGAYVAAAFDEERNAAIVVSTRGIFRHALDDFSAEPEQLSDELFNPLSRVGVNESLADGGNLLLHDSAGDVVVIDVATGETVNRFFVGQADVWGQLTNDGTRYHFKCVWQRDFCTPSQIITWDVLAGEQINIIELSDDASVFRFSADGETLFYVSDERSVMRRDVATGEEEVILIVEDTNNQVASALGISPDGQTLAVAYQTRQLDSLTNNNLILRENVRLYELEALLSEPLEARFDSYLVDNWAFISSYGRLGDDRNNYINFSSTGESFVVFAASVARISIADDRTRFLNDRIGMVHNVFDEQLDYFLDITVQSGITLKHSSMADLSESTDIYVSSATANNGVIALEDNVIWSGFGNDIVRWQITDEGATSQRFTVILDVSSLPMIFSFAVRDDEAHIGYIANSDTYMYSMETARHRRVDTLVIDPYARSITIPTPTLAMFGDDGLLYVTYREGEIRVYDGEEGYVKTIDYRPDDEFLSFGDALAPDASAVLTRRFYDNTLTQTLTLLGEEGVEGVIQLSNIPYSIVRLPAHAYSPDSQYLLASACVETEGVTCLNTEITVWSIESLREQLALAEDDVIEGEAVGTLAHPFTDVTAIAFRPMDDAPTENGRTSAQIAVQDGDEIHILAIPDLNDMTQGVELLYTIDSRGYGLTFSPDSPWLIVTQPGYLDVWELP